jgi:hypothetical protein
MFYDFSSDDTTIIEALVSATKIQDDMGVLVKENGRYVKKPSDSSYIISTIGERAAETFKKVTDPNVIKLSLLKNSYAVAQEFGVNPMRDGVGVCFLDGEKSEEIRSKYGIKNAMLLNDNGDLSGKCVREMHIYVDENFRINARTITADSFLFNYASLWWSYRPTDQSIFKRGPLVVPVITDKIAASILVDPFNREVSIGLIKGHDYFLTLGEHKKTLMDVQKIAERGSAFS